MSALKPAKAGSVAVNIVIALMIAFLYLCMQKPPEAFQAVGASAIYRAGGSDSVALQFLITWDAPAIDEILELLDERGETVTFIVSGEWAEVNAQRLIRMRREGHELGVCGYSPEEDGDYEWTLEDISRAMDIIEEAASVSPRVYYGGERDMNTSSRAAAALGLYNVRCTADLLCARGGADDIIERLKASATGGGIYLMTPTPAALEALPGIMDAVYDMGLTISATASLIEETEGQVGSFICAAARKQ